VGRYDHGRYLATVDEIEERTGLDLLRSMPDSIEREVERAQAPKVWPAEEEFFVVSAVVVSWIGSSWAGSLCGR
jgi:hypothetical protein